MAGNYFLGSELSGDNFVGTGVGVAIATGVGLGGIATTYAQESFNGLVFQGSPATLAVTNADPVTPADTFPGIANVGPGTFGLTNGTRLIYIDPGASYGSNGTSEAQIVVIDHQ